MRRTTHLTRLTRAARTPLVAALTIGACLTSAGAAMASDTHTGHATTSASTSAHATDSKPAGSHSAASKDAHPRVVVFTADGTVTAVDAAASTLTFTVHAGATEDLRGASLTVTTSATTVVRRAGAKAALSDLVMGDHVNVLVVGVASHDSALRVDARATSTTPAPAPTASPSASPSPPSA